MTEHSFSKQKSKVRFKKCNFYFLFKDKLAFYEISLNDIEAELEITPQTERYF